MSDKIFDLDTPKEELLDEIYKLNCKNIKATKRIDKAIEFLKDECLYDGRDYCDDLWCGDVNKLVNILRGVDE